jgi:DNA-directed RNA polymerase specialized sigma24 family protein
LAVRTADKRGGGRTPLSLDRFIDPDDSDTLGDLVVGPADTERSAIAHELQARVRAFMQDLPPSERRLLLQLLRDPSLTRASRELGVPRTTLGRQLKNITALAFDAGLRRSLD